MPETGQVLTEAEKETAKVLVCSGLPPKARYAEACNGCGLCCTLQLCPVAVAAFGPGPGPCPALFRVGDMARCLVVTTEIDFKLEPKVQLALGIGMGCGMRDDDTTDAEMLAFAAKTQFTTGQAGP